MIDNYSRKAQELIRKNEAAISGEQSIDDCKQPIEKWYDLVHSLVPQSVKKDDMASIFVDFFAEYPIDERPVNDTESNEDPEPNLRPDYRVIYDTIRDILDGKYAKHLEPINAFFILKLIEELKQFIKSDSNRKEMSFLKSGIWWQIPHQTNAMKSEDNIIRSVNALRRQDSDGQTIPMINNSHEMSQSTPEEEEEEFIGRDTLTNDMNEQNEVEYDIFRTYPKLRKVIECLNPLRVPVEMLAEEYIRWQQMW